MKNVPFQISVLRNSDRISQIINFTSTRDNEIVQPVKAVFSQIIGYYLAHVMHAAVVPLVSHPSPPAGR